MVLLLVHYQNDAARIIYLINMMAIIVVQLQVDAMLQELEHEIDDVDAKIGNRWQLLDR